tara:strand:- start:161 stop:601 length:441 start_codon:yes stop_codon:yes gene_type:complete
MEDDPQPEVDAPDLANIERRRRKWKWIVFILLCITSILSIGLRFASGIHWERFAIVSFVFTTGLIPLFFLAALLTFYQPLLPKKSFRFWLVHIFYILLLLVIPFILFKNQLYFQMEGVAYKINQIDRPALVKEARDYWKHHLPPGS